MPIGLLLCITLSQLCGILKTKDKGGIRIILTLTFFRIFIQRSTRYNNIINDCENTFANDDSTITSLHVTVFEFCCGVFGKEFSMVCEGFVPGFGLE
jgi:hypothetical protein